MTAPGPLAVRVTPAWIAAGLGWLSCCCLGLLGMSAVSLSVGQCQGASRPVDEQVVADVQAGRLKQAKASLWGFDSENATASLQSAIDSKCPRLIIDNVGEAWVVDPIQLVSDQELVFEHGVEVVARPGGFRGREDALFTARLKQRFTLRGFGAVLRMHRADYVKPPYATAEWRHVLSILSCRDVRILGLTLAEGGGDGVYLGATPDGGPNTDILIKDVTCDRNHRPGNTGVRWVRHAQRPRPLYGGVCVVGRGR